MAKKNNMDNITKKCIYCGIPTNSRGYILNPKAKKELVCCSKDCFEKAQAFVKWDFDHRTVFYLIGLVLIIINLVILQMNLNILWTYIPFISMGVLLYIFPLPIHHYTSYEYYGIEKTIKLIRKIAIIIILIGIFFSIITNFI